MLICLFKAPVTLYNSRRMLRIQNFNIRPETAEIVETQYRSLSSRFGPLGETPKAYHNATHAINVARVAARIAILMGKPEGFVNDVVVAGMFHDDIQSHGHGEDERKSAENAIKALRGYSYFTGKHKQRIYDAIMATNIDLDTFEQQAECEAGRVVADADLSGIGAEPRLHRLFSDKLFREFHPGAETSGETMYKFLGTSIVMLESHDFYTEAATLLLPNREVNLQDTIVRRAELAEKLGY